MCVRVCICLCTCLCIVNGDFPCVRSFQLPCVRKRSSLHIHKHMHMLSDISTALPTITDLPAPRTHTEGEQFELVCSFTGNPAPQIHWEKDGSTFLHGGNRRIINTSGRSQLEINNVALSDAGVYSCSVSNDVGNATRSVRLEVRGEGVK